jgi:3-hydroxyisobutyrate dehydrogenase-like beta-hydroxyacid dehydrogenase
MDSPSLHVGFIGLGRMGLPMARNLIGRGFTLNAWNRTPSRGDELVALGARLASTVAEASRADVVITMLADDAALESVVWPDGLIDSLRPDAIHVSMSTISVALADRLAAAHAERHTRFVSAPVFGRPQAAAAAQLFIVAAGAAAALERVQPVLDALGQRTFHFGERPSAANLVKLSGNLLIAVVIESLAEVLALARKGGVDPHQLVEMLTSTLFSAPVYATYGRLIADGHYRPAGFPMPLGLKDVGLVLDAARAATVPLPLASLVRDHMLAALAQGQADADWSALGELAARNAGLTPASRTD